MRRSGWGRSRRVGKSAALAYPARVNEPSPIVSEFESPEQAAAYEKWLREKVAASLADERPPVPHDEAMARARAVIEARRGKC